MWPAVKKSSPHDALMIRRGACSRILVDVPVLFTPFANPCSRPLPEAHARLLETLCIGCACATRKYRNKTRGLHESQEVCASEARRVRQNLKVVLQAQISPPGQTLTVKNKLCPQPRTTRHDWRTSSQNTSITKAISMYFFTYGALQVFMQHKLGAQSKESHMARLHIGYLHMSLTGLSTELC